MTLVAKETNGSQPCKTNQQQGRYVYVQPRLRRSLTTGWDTSCRPFESTTTYRQCYVPCTSGKADITIPEDALSLCKGEFATESSTRSAYQPLHGALPAAPHVPYTSGLMGTGTMQTTTTNREDYVPKVPIPKERVRPKSAIKTCEGCAFDSATTSRSSYQPPPLSFYKAKSLRRDQLAVKRVKFDESTVYNASYVEFRPQKVRQVSSVHKGTLGLSTQPIQWESTYRRNFQSPAGDHRLSS